MKPIIAFTQKGLSLVELMVAMLLALILIGGVVEIFLSSRQTYSTTSALSAVQENGRFASELLSFDIRNSAYRGECVTPIKNLTGFTTDTRFTLEKGLEGWDNSQSSLPSWFDASDRLDGTDVLLLKHAVNDSGAVAASGNITEMADASFVLSEESGISAGTVLVAADPVGCDIFINQDEDTDTTISRGDTGEFSHDYVDDVTLFRFMSSVYFVKAGGNGQVPSLWRIRYNNGSAGMDPELMIEGVQNMQVQYALGDGSGAITGDYLDANEITAADWEKVVSVRFSLLVVSRDTNVVAENQVIPFNGSDVTIQDRRLARVFTSTIGIRNRLP